MYVLIYFLLFCKKYWFACCFEDYSAFCLSKRLNVYHFQGAELAAQEGKSAAALAACRTLAEELTEHRFPAPRILAFKVCFLHMFIGLVLLLHGTVSPTQMLFIFSHYLIYESFQYD